MKLPPPLFYGVGGGIIKLLTHLHSVLVVLGRAVGRRRWARPGREESPLRRAPSGETFCSAQGRPKAGEGEGRRCGARGSCPSEPGVCPQPSAAVTRLPKEALWVHRWEGASPEGQGAFRELEAAPTACGAGLRRADVGRGSVGESAGLAFSSCPELLRLSPAVPICPSAAGQILARAPGVRPWSSFWAFLTRTDGSPGLLPRTRWALGPCEARLWGGGKGAHLGGRPVFGASALFQEPVPGCVCVCVCVWTGRGWSRATGCKNYTNIEETVE